MEPDLNKAQKEAGLVQDKPGTSMPTAAALLSRAGTAWGEPAVRAQVGEAPCGDPLQQRQPPALLAASITGRQPQAHLQSPGSRTSGGSRPACFIAPTFSRRRLVSGLQVAPSIPHLH